jgi:RimJ/RimL family protein N-acetyltransferase/gamma-glutamylcyclotransferase (GGCT)/AIG2-like uncharacterized protein YtfP
MDDRLFDTERLAVRRLRREDLDALLAVYGDADAMRWVGDGQALSREDALRWLDVTERNVATRGYGMCALALRHSHAIVGFIGLVHPGGQAQAELKYALARAYWGQGLAAEAARGMLDWGARGLGLRHVVATTAPQNTASHRVLRKAGCVAGALRRNDDGSQTQVFDWHAPPALPTRVFCYGTLKQGFHNFGVNRGVRLPGEFVSEQALPLYVIGAKGLPWLVYQPGCGHPVRGQVFEADAPALAAMDEFECIDRPDWYTRRPLRVRPAAGGAAIDAVAYFGGAERLGHEPVHLGPLPEYAPDMQALYRYHL